MKTIITSISIFFVVISCGNQLKKTNSKESSVSNPFGIWGVVSSNNWAKNRGLLNVESIVYDSVQQVFYATNGKNYEPGTNGFISKISKDGKLQELKWITGLNRPTGMAIHNSILYVADVNSLVLISTKSGAVLKKILEPIANSGLNDVAVNKNGQVFVSASFVHAILKLNNGKLELWVEDEEKLKWANGLVAEDKQIVVAGLNLSSINIDSKQLTNIDLNSSVKDFDGIASDDLGGYFLTTVENSGLYYFDGRHSIYELEKDTHYYGDIFFDKNRKRLYVPRGEKANADFFITEYKMEEQSKVQNK